MPFAVIIENKKIRRLCLCLIITIFSSITVDSNRYSASQPKPEIPSPEAASQQAAQMRPEDLFQIEVDDELRDQLISDSRWKPILQVLRQDMMEFRWGDGELKNPIWQRYGDKTYPLLDYYSRSDDPARRAYALKGIRSLGKPYTTFWLTKQLQIGGYIPYPSELGGQVLAQEFGLDDPKLREDLIKVAQENLDLGISPDYYDHFPDPYKSEQFNRGFLLQSLGYCNVEPISRFCDQSYFKPESIPELKQWTKYEQISLLDENIKQEILNYYNDLPNEAQSYILGLLSVVKAGEISATGEMLLESFMSDTGTSLRVWAIAELDRHGSPKGAELLQEILNGNLNEINQLTTAIDWELSRGERAIKKDIKVSMSQAYFLLVGIAEKYPQSRFIQGCREYGDLRGLSYFGHEPRSVSIRKNNANKTPSEWVKNWQQWLEKYPDHPGADDAIYFLAYNLQAQNDLVGAARQWLRLMTDQPGDQDAVELAWPHIRTLLNTGLSIEQIEELIVNQSDTVAAPLLKYALAVRYARSQKYLQALQASQDLDLTKMPDYVLDSYYDSVGYLIRSGPSNSSGIQQQMQQMLIEQRERWQNLRNWQTEKNIPESKYIIASDWASSSGWKNGYLPFWDNRGISKKPIVAPLLCKKYWVCNLAQRSVNETISGYQKANSNAIALSIYQDILNDSRTPVQLREKTLFMAASTSLTQWELYPIRETIAMHPLPGMIGTSQIDQIWQSADFSFSNPITQLDAAYPYYGDLPEYQAYSELIRQAGQRFEKALEISFESIRLDYQRHIDEIISELEIQFPSSPYIDDLLFENYFLSGQAKYLKKLIEAYPDSDRYEEARFLITRPTARVNNISPLGPYWD